MSDYTIRLGPAAAKAFAALDAPARDRIRKALERLAAGLGRPGRRAAKSVKTIQSTEDTFHRLRVGDHRVMYDVLPADRVILVLGIVHRAELERWLRRR